MMRFNPPGIGMTRREAMLRALGVAGGFGLASAGLKPLAARAESVAANPLSPRFPHYTPRAKRVIFFFQTGGVSHVDSFDPKPLLQQSGGKSVPHGNLLPSPWPFARRGKSGTLMTDLFPRLADHADDLCIIRSTHGDHNCHYQATLGMHTGSVTFPRPSIGAWVSYALGTMNANLPSYVVFAADTPYAGSLVWDSNFLPGSHQGVRVLPGNNPVPNLRPGQGDAAAQPIELSLLERMNTRHLQARADDKALAARMLAFKTAYGLQQEAPEAFDVAGESDATLDLYGLQRGDRKSFAWQCLAARRLAERGVRFIELIDIGSHNNWDAHGNIMTHAPLAKAIDQPIAGLLTDLRQRGMLDETLIVWCTEFGRTPYAEGASAKGRSHHNRAFSVWLAGAGVKGGTTYGATDEYGIEIAENPVHVHDFHATILHLLGLNHEKLTYLHEGRNYRLTDVSGNVVQAVLA